MATRCQARFALTNPKTFQDLPFFAELLHLAAQLTEFLQLGAGQTVVALAPVAIGLRHPVPDGLGRRLELPRQRLRADPGPDHLDHPATVLRRVRCS